MKILHLNYVLPRYQPRGETEWVEGKPYPVVRKELDRPAIYYGYPAAKLWGHESYSGVSDEIRLAQDDIYFTDLGKPLGTSYEERDGLVKRYYEKGIVVLNPAEVDRTADLRSPMMPPELKGLWDCYARKAVEEFTVTIEPTTSFVSQRSYSAGRVYLYLR